MWKHIEHCKALGPERMFGTRDSYTGSHDFEERGPLYPVSGNFGGGGQFFGDGPKTANLILGGHCRGAGFEGEIRIRHSGGLP